MTIKLKKIDLNLRTWTTSAFIFSPSEEVEHKKTLAIMTHGYTSHKGSILNWPTRLAEEGISSVLFDLPGHYLGSSNEVEDFSEFTEHVHKFFNIAYKRFIEQSNSNITQLVLCGHSLGALLSLKALQLEEFETMNKYSICVGLGSAPEKDTHIFNTSFYKSTLNIRSQLVSPQIHPDLVFPWIKNEKENINLSNQKVILITGQDDLVVPEDGTEKFAKILQEQGNSIQVLRPSKLPHHQPELASGHIKSAVIKNLN
ncbi:MAG: alpha/beta fold hydrolase [Halobacteriovoraceae bacterium]|nr:alpha/beta fold hydrolase [Halobacteriovoraceae bacterium]